jgi:hypothetical protein
MIRVTIHNWHDPYHSPSANAVGPRYRITPRTLSARPTTTLCPTSSAGGGGCADAVDTPTPPAV